MLGEGDRKRVSGTLQDGELGQNVRLRHPRDRRLDSERGDASSRLCFLLKDGNREADEPGQEFLAVQRILVAADFGEPRRRLVLPADRL